jgi:hypothetical protein
VTTPPDLVEQVSYYLARLKGHSDAWHSLRELGPEALPYLSDAFERENTIDRRVSIVEIVNEYRTDASIDFLTKALASKDDAVWKTALDGLVTLGSRHAQKVVRAALTNASPLKREWLDEALTQSIEGAR